jgi:hypothetical protein
VVKSIKKTARIAGNLYLLVGIFGGFAVGYLEYTSGWFSKALGIVLGAACVSYLVDVLAAFILPETANVIHSYAIVLPAIAEPWMVLYPPCRWCEGPTKPEEMI